MMLTSLPECDSIALILQLAELYLKHFHGRCHNFVCFQFDLLHPDLACCFLCVQTEIKA